MARAPKKIIAKKDDTPHETHVVLHTIKGFERDLSCRGFKFEVGKSYSVSGEIECCSNGFHACENPLDVLSHYPASTSVFHEVEQSGEIARHDVDSKIASATITIGVEISLNDLIARGVKWIFDKVDFMNAPATNTGYRSAATNTGDHSAATNTGYRSAATNTSYQSAATNTGDQSAATNTGDRSAATNTGYHSAATNTGYRSAATNTGDQSAATNTGYHSAATNTGDRSAATNTGYRSAATNTGDQSAATNTGYHSAATNTGDRSAASVEGKASVAVSIGVGGKARGSLGCAICLVHRNENTGEITAIRASKVGENGVKPDTWYSLNAGGEFVEESE